MAKQRRQIIVHHVFKDGTVSDTTEGHPVPAEIVQKIHQIAVQVAGKAQRELTVAETAQK